MPRTEPVQAEARTLEEYEARRREAEAPGLPVPERVQALLRASVLAENLGRPADAATLAGRALETAVAHGDQRGHISALSELGVQARTRGEFEQSEKLLRESEALAGEHGDKPLLARARANLAVTLRRAGKPDRAFDESNAAARLYRDLGELPGANRMLQLQAQIQQDQGLLHDAKATLEEVIGLFGMIGDDVGRARALGNLGLLLWRIGELEHAAARLEQAMQFFVSTGSRIDVIRARSNLGLVRRSAGDMAGALECFAKSVDETTELGLPVERAHALSNMASTLVMCERWTEAEACLNAIGAGCDYRLRHTDLLTRARIAMNRSDADAALSHAREAAALAREADNPRCLAEALRHEADLLHTAGKVEAAREAILQALEHLEQGGEIACEEHLVCTAIAAAIEHTLGNEENARLLAQSAVEMIDRHRNNPDPDVRRAIAGLRALVG